jgi:hypothetical protein
MAVYCRGYRDCLLISLGGAVISSSQSQSVTFDGRVGLMMLIELRCSHAKSLFVSRVMAADFRGYVSRAHTHVSLDAGCNGHIYICINSFH